MNLEETDDRNELDMGTRNCDVPLGTSDNIRQAKFKNRLRLFNTDGNCSRLFRLVLPSFNPLARKASSSFSQFFFPAFSRHFGQQ